MQHGIQFNACLPSVPVHAENNCFQKTDKKLEEGNSSLTVEVEFSHITNVMF